VTIQQKYLWTKCSSWRSKLFYTVLRSECDDGGREQ